jgi:hypothetical protein
MFILVWLGLKLSDFAQEEVEKVCLISLHEDSVRSKDSTSHWSGLDN